MPENKVYTAIGMMSGTSLDAVDVALVETDGKEFIELKGFTSFDYTDEERDTIKQAFGQRTGEDIDRATDIVTNAHIRAINDTLEHFPEFKADVIGFHGQTTFHDPNNSVTVQIGDAQKLAIDTGINVVADMRQADVKSGGQGAPLLPLCHRALSKDIEKPTAILNLGGVGNITWLGHEEENILAFDTGPANALMNDLMMKNTGKPFDHEGEIAASGTPNYDVLNQWMDLPFFQKTPPKSLDRDAWDVKNLEGLSFEDAMATLAEFTVLSVVRAYNELPEAPKTLYVAGGGRHNKLLMNKLSDMLLSSVHQVDELKWNGDALEAQGFAYLATRSLLGLPLSLPGTTGVKEPTTGGTLYSCNQNAQTAEL